MIGISVFFLAYLTGTGLVCYAIGAFTLMKLWSWIITPTFGIDPISFFAAVGLIMILRLLRSKNISKTEIESIQDIHDNIGHITRNTFIYVMFCGLTLLSGYMIKGFI